MTKSNRITYQSAGVNIDAGQELVKRIIPLAKQTHNKCVLSSIGGFSALYELPLQQYRQPIMVSSTDGVGTKLKLAIALNNNRHIGIDLVAMCVNDLLVCGANPLFFLDYYATGKLDVDAAEQIIAGICQGCKQAEMALIGGETAELPGLYQAQEYDLAGFSVGIVEKDQIIDGTRVTAGDQIIALASSGLHANGYSLIRKLISSHNIDLQQPFADTSLGEHLLTPTRIYVKTILSLLKKINIKAMAHITGGGIIENLPRVLPNHVQAHIDLTSWTFSELYAWVQQHSQLSTEEMLRTFNCGAGFLIIINPSQLSACLDELHALGEKNCWHIGQINPRDEHAASVTW